MSKAKLMRSNTVEISLILRQILGPLVLGWAPNHFVLGAQLAPGEKRLVCIPVTYHGNPSLTHKQLQTEIKHFFVIMLYLNSNSCE